MVGVAQLVELRLVMPAVVGSSPIVHPIQPLDFIDVFVVRLMLAPVWHQFGTTWRAISLNRRPNGCLFRVRISVDKARVSSQKRLVDVDRSNRAFLISSEAVVLYAKPDPPAD